MKKRIQFSIQGSEHAAENRCNQDNLISLPELKLVMDGCGSCDYSDVGVRVFKQLFEQKVQEEKYRTPSFQVTIDYLESLLEQTFDCLVEYFSLLNLSMDNLHFTILAVVETKEYFIVLACGDGYIITEKKDGEIEFQEISNGEFPKYFIYNYISDLDLYQEGVAFDAYYFCKEEYQNVGVATDGLRYYNSLSSKDAIKFTKMLSERKNGAICSMVRRLNRDVDLVTMKDVLPQNPIAYVYHVLRFYQLDYILAQIRPPVFKDDLTICF